MADLERFTQAFSQSRAASDFDRLGEHLWRPIGEATVRRSAPRVGERVLDACCGNGASALPAARMVGPDGHVDAVDLAEPLLAELREHAGGQENVTATAADATTWPSGEYDLLQCVLGIFFFPDMTAGTEHLISRVRPGGRVALTIWRRGAVEDAGRHLAGAIASVTGTELPPRPAHPVDEISTVETFGAWLQGRGLVEVEVHEAPLSLDMTPETAWLVITGSGFAGMLGELDDQEVERVRDTYLSSLRSEGAARLDATALIGIGRRPSR